MGAAERHNDHSLGAERHRGCSPSDYATPQRAASERRAANQAEIQSKTGQTRSQSMREMMLVAAGGSLGALSRYATGLAAARLFGTGFPWGTLLVKGARAGVSLGALSRYAAGLAAARLFGTGFPWGTLLVNVAGSFAMGLVMSVILDLESHTAESITPVIKDQLAFWHRGVAIGFLGGLTTFSS